MKPTAAPGAPLHPEDPRLTTFLLGELPEKEAALVRDAAASDPAIAKALDELRAAKKRLTDVLAQQPLTLDPDVRESLRATAVAASPKPLPVRRILMGTTVMIFFLIIVMRPGREKNQTRTAHDSPPPPASAVFVKSPDPRLPAAGPQHPGVLPPTAAAPQSDFPPLGQRGFITPAELPFLALPMAAENHSMGWVRQSILTEGKLPPRDAVRTEELLNAIELRPTGTAVLRGAVLTAETLACPWRPSSTLLFVSFQGKRNAPATIDAAFHPTPASVGKYRLLGWLPAASAQSSRTLPASANHLLMLEIETSGTDPQIGEIRWKIDGSDAPSLAIVRKPDAEPSDDARFAALICLFAEWLAGDGKPEIDSELVAAFARELAAPGLPADREAFLQLIDRAIRL